MAWEQLTVVLPRTLLPELSALLFSAGCAGLEERESTPPRQLWDRGPAPAPAASERLEVRAWFEERSPDLQARLGAIPGCEWSWEALPDTDWSTAWRAEHAAFRVGRILVAPPWDAPEGAIVVEPGQGFGTGQHPTTRAMLAAVDFLADEARTCLDVGCGSGVLALAAARLGVTARGIDVDANAVAEAKKNAAASGLTVPFEATPLADVEGSYDLVLANLHAEVLVPLLPDLVRLTGRWLVVSGVLLDREHLVAPLQAALTLRQRDVLDERWLCLRFSVRQ